MVVSLANLIVLYWVAFADWKTPSCRLVDTLL